MSLKVHPGFGVARIGNSPTNYGIAPETIEIEAPPQGGYRDAECRLVRLGARFHVFDYPAVGAPVELIIDASTQIEWSVQLGVAGPEMLAGTSGVETISGPNQVKVFTPTVVSPGTNEYSLAELRTDSEGRLIVLSGMEFGVFQGQCDGRVMATVHRGTGPEVAVESRVLITAPDFAPGRRPVISYYDLLYQRHGLPAPSVPSFRKDILPILRARNAGRPLAVEGSFPLLSGASERQMIAGIDLATPPMGETGSGVTAVQFATLVTWINGTPGVDYVNDWPAPGTIPPPIPLTPEELDRGPLSHCITGGTWEIKSVPTSALLPNTLCGDGSLSPPSRDTPRSAVGRRPLAVRFSPLRGHSGMGPASRS